VPQRFTVSSPRVMAYTITRNSESPKPNCVQQSDLSHSSDEGAIPPQGPEPILFAEKARKSRPLLALIERFLL